MKGRCFCEISSGEGCVMAPVVHGEFEPVSHRNGFRAEYSGRNLAEYSAETVSVKNMGFGDERNVR